MGLPYVYTDEKDDTKLKTIYGRRQLRFIRNNCGKSCIQIVLVG